MSGYLLRQLVTAALTANAVRPVPGYRAAVPSMAAGWLTSELAPHLLALTAADTAYAAARGHSRTGRLLAAGSSAALAGLVAQSALSKGYVDRALVEALGEDYRDRLSASYTDLDLSTPLRQLAMPFRVNDDEVEILKDVAYDTEHGKRGLLDVYRQRDADLSSAPVLLQVHGGGWSIGNKEHQGIPLMLHMAARGWVCVAINYRLSPRDPLPAHIVDVKRAIAWIRENVAEYGGDPSFLADHRRLGRRPPRALAALTPNDPEYQPGFEDVDTTVAGRGPALRRLRLRRGDRHEGRRRPARPVPGAEGDVQATRRSDLTEFEKASPAAARHRRRPDRSSWCTAAATRWWTSTRPGSSSAALRAVSAQPVAYAELPGTQHAFDVFPSIRSAHVVRGVDRFLRCSYDAWMHGRTQP